MTQSETENTPVRQLDTRSGALRVAPARVAAVFFIVFMGSHAATAETPEIPEIRLGETGNFPGMQARIMRMDSTRYFPNGLRGYWVTFLPATAADRYRVTITVVKPDGGVEKLSQEVGSDKASWNPYFNVVFVTDSVLNTVEITPLPPSVSFSVAAH